MLVIDHKAHFLYVEFKDDYLGYVGRIWWRTTKDYTCVFEKDVLILVEE